MDVTETVAGLFIHATLAVAAVPSLLATGKLRDRQRASSGGAR